MHLTSILYSQSMIPHLQTFHSAEKAQKKGLKHSLCESTLPASVLLDGPVNFNHYQMPGTESLPLLVMPGALSLSPF